MRRRKPPRRSDDYRHPESEALLRPDWAVTRLATDHRDHVFLNATKARTRLIEPLLEAAGIYGLPYTRYHEIAALMRRDEIHPEVLEKLDTICRAFGVEP